MKTHWIALMLMSAVGLGLLAGRVTAGEHEEKPGAADGGAGMVQPTLGEEHKELASLAGEYDATLTMYMGGQEMVAAGDSETGKMVMNGWFLQSDYSGNFMGKPWKGRSLMGFNQMTKEYEGIWYSEMGSSISIHKGKKCPKGIIHLYGSSPHPQTGKMAASLMQLFPADEAGTHKMEMHFTDENKKSNYKMMQIVYSKKK